MLAQMGAALQLEPDAPLPKDHHEIRELHSITPKSGTRFSDKVMDQHKGTHRSYQGRYASQKPTCAANTSNGAQNDPRPYSANYSPSPRKVVCGFRIR